MAPNVPPKRPQKSICVAYFLWLFGGFFGLHLFYLRRDAQAFLTWSTLGGYGLGWLADVTKIPLYVRDANDDPRFIEEFVHKLRNHRKPPFSTSRFISATMVSYFWCQLILMAIPETEVSGFDLTFLHWLAPAAAALGVWVVGNIGREKGKIWATLLAAYISYLLRFYVYDDSVWATAMSFITALAFDTYSKEWRRTPPKHRSFFMRLAILSICGSLYIALWGSYLYYNAKITDANDEEIPLSEAIHHFFTSPWWTDLKQSLEATYNYAQHHGWYEIWKQVVELSDPHGEQNAHKVLGVSSTASQSEITSQWRKLSREWHPDKVKDPNLQRDAQERFMEIQQAYEILSSSKAKRRRQNKKSVQ